MSQDGAGVVTTYYAGPHYEVRVAGGQDQVRLNYRFAGGPCVPAGSVAVS